MNIILGLSCLALAWADINSENGVLVLNDSNFDNAVASHDFLLVEFYAPWCGYCKQLAPEWDAAAIALKDASVNIKLAKIDATENDEITRRFMISGFPTIYFFKYHEYEEYLGPRDTDGIVSWAKKHSGPPATLLTSLASLEEVQDGFDVIVVGFFANVDSALAKMYYSVAEMTNYINFFITTSEELASHYNVTGESVVVLKHFDEPRADFHLNQRSFSKNDILKFVKEYTYPLVSVFSNRDARKIFAPRILTHALVFTDRDAPHHESAIATATEVASEFRGEVQFINILAEDKGKLEYFGVDPDSLPGMVVVQVDEMNKFPFRGDFNAEAISAHLNSVMKGELSMEAVEV